MIVTFWAGDVNCGLSVAKGCALGYNFGMSWNILGHEWAVSLLQNTLQHGDPHHAYLFTGRGGVGRRTLALRLAQAINCTQPPEAGVPCGQCRACRLIAQMQHPDLSVVQADTEGGTLKVEQVRELQRALALAPYEARYRVALLLRFEEAHPSAANALLKTLEEPPARVILLLTASDGESLLPTILSRCEVLRLRPPARSAVAQHLIKQHGCEPAQAQLLANLSDGCPGAAVRLLENPQALEQRDQWLAEHLALLHINRAERFRYAEKLSKDKATLRPILLTWLSLWRDVLLQAAGAAAPISNMHLSAQISDLAQKIGLARTHQFVQRLERTFEQLDRNVNPKLLLEVVLLDLPHIR